MSFRIRNCEIEQIKELRINGTAILQNVTYIELTAKTKDDVDSAGNIKRIWCGNQVIFGYEDYKRVIITLNPDDDSINVYIKCLAWTKRPHKKYRTSKKWTKQRGAILRNYTLNWNMCGTWEIK